MKVAIHQPAYLPYLGHLAKIDAADVFVYLDCVQFEKNGWQNRNRVKGPAGLQWLTIPVRAPGHLGRNLYDVTIDERNNWRTRHMKTLRQLYSKAEFGWRVDELSQSYDLTFDDHLVEVLWYQLQWWCEKLGITTTLVRQSEMNEMGRKSSDLLVALCRELGATTYLSGPSGLAYLDAEMFDEAHIDVEYQKWTPKAYPQLYGGFRPNLSVVDAWLNVQFPAL